MVKKISLALGGIFSGLGALGLWGVCHGICQLLIAVLAVMGITIIGMPLAFLTDSRFIQISFFLGGLLLFISLVLYLRHRKNCTTNKKEACPSEARKHSRNKELILKKPAFVKTSAGEGG